MIRNYFKVAREMEDVLNLYPWNSKELHVVTFNRIRLWFNKFDLIEKSIPKSGKIIDIGCGYGLFANFLALRSSERFLIGLDKNSRKIKYANRGLKNTKFFVGDVRNFDLERCQGITLIDFLHHMDSYQEQEKLLNYCSACLEKGGILFIKEVGYEPYFKFLLTSCVDHVLYFGQRFYFRNSREYEKLMKSFGFEVKLLPIHHETPYSAYGLICQKI